MRRIIPVVLLILGLAVVLAGCSGGGDGSRVADDGMLTVAATTSMIGDAVRNIAGDSVVLHTLMGPGVDPHLYKATKGDLDVLSAADLVFYNGLHLEAKMAEILKGMSGTKRTVAVAESLADSLIRYPSEFEGAPDPHIWFDVSMWRQAVMALASELALADSARASYYLENARRFTDSLSRLHSWVGGEMAGIPDGQRVLVTAHDAFGYFGRAYGIEVRGLQGISTVTEAGLYDITSMIDMLVARKIKAVFVESSVSPKTIEAVVAGCRDKGHEVTIGGQLYSDAMGQSGTAEGTYVGMVEYNVRTIVEALR